MVLTHYRAGGNLRSSSSYRNATSNLKSTLELIYLHLIRRVLCTTSALYPSYSYHSEWTGETHTPPSKKQKIVGRCWTWREKKQKKRNFKPRKQGQQNDTRSRPFFFIIPVLFFVFVGVLLFSVSRVSLHHLLLLSLYMSMSVYELWLLLILISSRFMVGIVSFPRFLVFFNGDGAKVVICFCLGIYHLCLLLWSTFDLVFKRNEMNWC